MALWPELSPLVLGSTQASDWVPATHRDVILSRWCLGRVGVIADAAYAMSQQLGQGINLELLDALAIARAVDACNDWEHVWPQLQRRAPCAEGRFAFTDA